MNMNGHRQAIAQPTKQAFLFVFNRETGEPIWPIEERPVPQSDVPKNAPARRSRSRQSRRPSIAGHHRERPARPDAGVEGRALEVAKRYKMGPIFTPPVVSSLDGPLATLQVPSEVGGANWPGGSFDPESNHLYVHSHRSVY